MLRRKNLQSSYIENEIEFYHMYVESDRSWNNWEFWFPLLIYADLDRKKQKHGFAY